MSSGFSAFTGIFQASAALLRDFPVSSVWRKESLNWMYNSFQTSSACKLWIGSNGKKCFCTSCIRFSQYGRANFQISCVRSDRHRSKACVRSAMPFAVPFGAVFLFASTSTTSSNFSAAKGCRLDKLYPFHTLVVHSTASVNAAPIPGSILHIIILLISPTNKYLQQLT